MKKKDIKILAKRLSHAIRKIGSDADKDWRIVIVLFIVGLFVSIFFHINTFISIQNTVLKEENLDTKKHDALDSLTINDMIQRYEKRAVEYKKFASSTNVLIDPAR